jgi:hypothetical protein
MLGISNRFIDSFITRLIYLLYYIKTVNKNREVNDSYKIHNEIVLTEDIIYY